MTLNDQFYTIFFLQKITHLEGSFQILTTVYFSFFGKFPKHYQNRIPYFWSIKKWSIKEKQVLTYSSTRGLILCCLLYELSQLSLFCHEIWMVISSATLVDIFCYLPAHVDFLRVAVLTIFEESGGLKGKLVGTMHAYSVRWPVTVWLTVSKYWNTCPTDKTHS